MNQNSPHDSAHDFARIRHLALEQQIRPWMSVSAELAQAFLRTERERFLPEHLRAIAYTDTDLPMGGGQVMLSPKVQMRLITDLQLKPSDRVLQIGAGTGYMTALIAQVAAQVTAYECVPELAQSARINLLQAQINNASIVAAQADASPPSGAFDAIVFCGALAQLPAAWLQHLPAGGRLAAIVGHEPMMRATLITRSSDEETHSKQAWDTLAPYLQGFAPAPSFAL